MGVDGAGLSAWLGQAGVGLSHWIGNYDHLGDGLSMDWSGLARSGLSLRAWLARWGSDRFVD